MSYYSNPAFCQKSEFYPRVNRNVSSDGQIKVLRNASVSRNESIQSERLPTKPEHLQHIQDRKLPPKPSIKHVDANVLFRSERVVESNHVSKMHLDGYALVPLDEIPSASKNRYAILPPEEVHLIHNNSSRLTKSQDDLDYVSSKCTNEEENSFLSLPPIELQEKKEKLVSAFSTDFINKSMILVDRNNMQKYTIVPTDDDEEVVDSNHEIIEMHNGRMHRYAVIPADDDEVSMRSEFVAHATVQNQNPRLKACSRSLSMSTDMQMKNSYKFIDQNVGDAGHNEFHAKQKPTFISKVQPSTIHNGSLVDTPGTPSKNPIATQKLHELLSTPRKNKQELLQRHGSYQTIIQRSPNQILLQQQYCGQAISEFTPQKLHYDNRKNVDQNIDQRTMAIISPRLHQNTVYNESTEYNEKACPNDHFQKVENATTTIGIVSLMLILTGVINSGLCLYLVTNVCIDIY